MSGNIFKLRLQQDDFKVLLNECRKKKEFIDVQLQVGDKLFDAHRNVLSLYSPVLKAMLSDQWSTSKICPISGEYVDPSIVDELLHFLYTGSIDLTPDNVHPVCVAAHFLQIATLLEPSVQHLCRLISVDNVLTLFEFSHNSQLEILRDSCLQFIARNNAEVFQDSRILELSVENFKNLIAELREQFEPIWNNRIQQQVNTFDCIVRWTEVNLSERLDELPGLLKSIPLEELPQNFLTGTVFTHPLVKGSISGSQAVSTALTERESRWRNRQNLIVFGEDPRTGSAVQCFDWLTGSWTTLPDLLEPRREYECTIFNKRNIVVSGGFKPNGDNLNSVEMFDWTNQTWGKLADLPNDPFRMDYTITELNGHLYASEKIPSEVNGMPKLYCYSFETQQWRPLTSMNQIRLNYQLVGCGNHLYAFRGRTSEVEKYDPLLDQWSLMDSMAIDQHLYNATVHLGKIYAWGERCDLMMFDPGTGAWASFPGYLRNESRDILSMNRKLVTLEADGYVSEFDFTTQEWKKFFKLDFELNHLRMIAGEFY